MGINTQVQTFELGLVTLRKASLQTGVKNDLFFLSERIFNLLKITGLSGLGFGLSQQQGRDDRNQDLFAGKNR